MFKLLRRLRFAGLSSLWMEDIMRGSESEPITCAGSVLASLWCSHSLHVCHSRRVEKRNPGVCQRAESGSDELMPARIFLTLLE